MMQVTDMDSMNAVGASNDLTMSSDLGATIPPPTDFGLPPPPPQQQQQQHQSGQDMNPMTSQYSGSPMRHHFGLSGESGIEWLGSPTRQPPVTLIRGSSTSSQGQNQQSNQNQQSQQSQPTQQGPGVHFDLKM